MFGAFDTASTEVGPQNPIMPVLPAGYGRYFFIDGDNGSDANPGYIDAPLGSTFTAPQTAAIAVKTTDRLEAITPPLGNGQVAIRLWKPRGAGAVYDKKTAGDGLGRCDRRTLLGYQQFIDRGSDLTNSAADRAQLGLVTAGTTLVVDSVADVWPSPASAVTLVGASFADPFVLTQQRAHFLTAGGDIYAPIQGGNPALGGDPDVVVAWFLTGAVTTGDRLVLEVPGVRVATYYEANTSMQVSSTLPTQCWQACGFEVTGHAFLGCPAGGLGLTDAPLYCCFVVDGLTTISGDAIAGPAYNDETQNPGLSSGFGLATKGAGTSDGRVSLECSSITNAFTFGGDELDCYRSRLGDSPSNFVAVAPATRATLSYLVYQGIKIGPTDLAQVSSLRHVDDTGASCLILAPLGHIAVTDVKELNGATVAAPGIVIQPTSQGTVDLDFGAVGDTEYPLITVGNGVSLYIGDYIVPIDYAGLLVTGFEVIGGVKVTCYVQNASYDDNLLPCPRAKLSHLVGSEAPFPVPVGTLVAAAPNYNNDDVATAVCVSPLVPPIGVTVINSISDGYVLVSADSTGIAMSWEDGDAPYPATNAPVYLSASVDGTITAIAPSDPTTPRFFIGRVLPLGYDGAKLVIFCSWEPDAIAYPNDPSLYLDSTGNFTTPAGGSGGLQVLYSVDFATLAPANEMTGGDGTKTIDGKPWNLKNTAYAQDVYLNDGTHNGLYLRCNTSPSDYYGATITAPRFIVGLTDLCGRKWQDLLESWLFVIFSQPHTPNASYQGVRVGVKLIPNPAEDGLSTQLCRAYGASALVDTIENRHANSTIVATADICTAPPLSDDIMAFHMMANNLVEIYSGQSVAGNFPSPLSTLIHGLTLSTVCQISNFNGTLGGWGQLLYAITDFNNLQWAFLLACSSGIDTSGNSDALLSKLMIAGR
jgi:hypothetical protein